jgi:hypothetical protein
MYSKTFLVFLSISIISCNANSANSEDAGYRAKQRAENERTINPYASIAAIPLPDGFKRMSADSNSFAAWLRHTGLKKDKTVYLYNGDEKPNQQAQFAVLDISTGDKDLQQCADAVMRLRAEYLFATAQFDKIIFTDNEAAVYQFTAPFTKDHFQHYLQKVFGMCGSASLSKQLKLADFKSVQPGDVLIRGGFPGHAEIVMDVAVSNSGKIIYLLAQSYMPAQDIHVLVNPNSKSLSPWYEVNEDENIITPEYLFRKSELKRW